MINFKRRRIILVYSLRTQFIMAGKAGWQGQEDDSSHHVFSQEAEAKTKYTRL